MSSPRETIYDPFNSWKFLVFPTIKATDIFSLFVKATLLVTTVVSISLLFYSAFSNQSQWLRCPECNGVLLSGHRKLTKGNNAFDDSYQETNVSHIYLALVAPQKHGISVGTTVSYGGGLKSPEEDTSRFKYSCSYGSRSALHIARIVKESFELGLDNVRWFVMGDDDTVFFVENLVMVLAKYDHNQMYYIGGNSESVEQDVIHSYTMAYGGGGFAISYPLAKELVRVWMGCIDRYTSFYGSDQRVQACMSEIGIPLTKELGFHQVDIRGNPYGLLASHPLAPLVSLHHLDYVQSIFPGMTRIDSLKKLIVPYGMDPGRTLQHSFCYDLNRNWSVSISWATHTTVSVLEDGEATGDCFSNVSNMAELEP
ncbi:hypothetical protein GH714_009963 [Hevea brasiliensis]|uniref:Uncharacterized protein n=1 Tax=Hevea brasiliensis TaxID=3981 RepID=A0A6A6KIA2_HEVBR|nr:hypothetical protein GH714_009963 [Hevea brasiliensis]